MNPAAACGSTGGAGRTLSTAGFAGASGPCCGVAGAASVDRAGLSLGGVFLRSRCLRNKLPSSDTDWPSCPWTLHSPLTPSCHPNKPTH